MAQATKSSMPKLPYAIELAREYGRTARGDARSAKEDAKTPREREMAAQECKEMAREYGRIAREDGKMIWDQFSEERREHSMGWELMLDEDD